MIKIVPLNQVRAYFCINTQLAYLCVNTKRMRMRTFISSKIRIIILLHALLHALLLMNTLAENKHTYAYLCLSTHTHMYFTVKFKILDQNKIIKLVIDSVTFPTLSYMLSWSWAVV